ncbi:hypothetical protein [Nocardia testacea]|uniref:hypothetical protein n=1 Tax=Nocardia testacea TaxID=248551 RepID=UPI0002E7FD4C|nr:hypothetical protein [Nocardia testacea]
MALSTYNGFPGEYRDRVQTELNKMWASSLWEPPSVCVVCEQADGAIHGHLEDYSQPESYVPLCITCHLILHTRFRQPDLWTEYCAWIRAGHRPGPQSQQGGFWAVKKCYLSGRSEDWPGALVNRPRRATYLDALAPVKFQHPNAPVPGEIVHLF